MLGPEVQLFVIFLTDKASLIFRIIIHTPLRIIVISVYAINTMVTLSGIKVSTEIMKKYVLSPSSLYTYQEKRFD